MTEYTEEWYRLSVRNNLNETDAQQVSRYVGGLKGAIREKIGLQVIWTVEEAQNMALKGEMMEKTTSKFSSYKKDVVDFSGNTSTNRDKSQELNQNNNKTMPANSQP